jgi:hypothetical protein
VTSFAATRAVRGATVVILLLLALSPAQAQQPADCGYYTNSLGHEVPRAMWGSAEQFRSPPPGATALCERHLQRASVFWWNRLPSWRRRQASHTLTAHLSSNLSRNEKQLNVTPQAK